MNRSEETVQTEFLPVQTSADLSTQSEISQNNGSEENVVTCNKSDFSFQTEADVQSLAPFQGECMKKSSFKNKSTSTGEGCSNYSVKELLTALSSSEITFQPRNSEIINNTLSAYCSFQDCNQAVQIYYERMLDLAEELKEKRKKLLGKGYRPKDFQEDLNMQYGSTNCQWLERHFLKGPEFAKKYQDTEMSLHKSTNLSTFNVTGSSASGMSKRRSYEDKEQCIPKPLLTLSYHVNGITEIDNKVIILCCNEGLFAANHEISLNLYCISNKPCAKKLMYAPRPQKSFLLAGSGTRFNLMACCSEFLESFTCRITNKLLPVFYTFDLFFNDFTINERRDVLAASSHNKVLLFHLSHNDEIIKQIVVQMDEPIYALCFVEDDSIGFFSRIFYSADVKTGKFYEMIQKKDSISLLENSGLDFSTSLSPVDIKCHRNKPDEVLILIGKAAMTVDLPSRKMKYSFLSFFQTPINAIRYGDILMTIFEHWIEFIDLSNQAAYDLTTIHSAVLYRVYVGNIVNAIGPDMSGRYSFLIVKSDDQYNIHVLQSQNIVMMLRKSLGRDPAVGVRV